MTEEIKEELKVQKKEKCECCGKCLKIFLLGILASFLGCLIALCIFSAAMKPKMPPPPSPMMFGAPPVQQLHQGKFRHGGFHRGKRDFRPNLEMEKVKKDFEKEMRFQEPRPDFNED